MTNPPTPTAALREALARLPKVPWTKSGATVAIPETEDFAGKALSITGLDKQYARALAAYIAAANPAVIAGLLAQLDPHPTGWRDIATRPLIARALDEWHEDDGPVMWWAWCGHEWAGEPAWCGTPGDSDWPGYHTHWTPHPKFPAVPGVHPAEQQEGQPVPVLAAAMALLVAGGFVTQQKVDEAIQIVLNTPGMAEQQEGDAAGEKDAARYRWLRDNATRAGVNLYVNGSISITETLDADVDAAMQAMKGEGNG